MNPAFSVYRSFTRDPSVSQAKLPPGLLRRILRYADPYRAQVVVFLVITVLDASLVVTTPLLLKRIVDDGVVPHHRGVVTSLALVVAALAVLDACLSLAGTWYSSRIGEGLIYDLRTAVFSHVQSMPVAFFTRTQTGALVSRLNTDVIGAQQAFTSTLANVVSNFVTLAMVGAAMLYLSWPLTLLALALFPVFLVPARLVGRRLQALTRESMQLNAELSTTMTERFNVAGALLVKLFGWPRDEAARFGATADRVRGIGIRTSMANRVFFASMLLVASLSTALVYGVGGQLAVSGNLTVGTLLALAALLARLYAPLSALSNVRVDVMTALVSFDRVFEVLDLKPMIVESPDPKPLPAGTPALEFQGVEFCYPSADEVSLASLEAVALRSAGAERAGSGPVLRGIDLHLPSGHMLALVGPSGAGKTTVANLVARLYDPTAGVVRLGGVDLRDLRLDTLRETIGVVSQDAHMFHDTIRANLLYARPEATEDQLRLACREAQILDLVDSLPAGFDTVVGDRGHRLSGGEKQRLALARLMLKAPSVVVLDEATAHLDSEVEAAVQRALANTLAGRTSIVIAHRLSTVRAADQILVLDRGRVVQHGTHEQLLAAGGLYAELHRTQFALT